jgi:hypothetical protein
MSCFRRGAVDVESTNILRNCVKGKDLLDLFFCNEGNRFKASSHIDEIKPIYVVRNDDGSCNLLFVVVLFDIIEAYSTG